MLYSCTHMATQGVEGLMQLQLTTLSGNQAQNVTTELPNDISTHNTALATS